MIPFVSVSEYKTFARLEGTSLDAYFDELLNYITSWIQAYTQQYLSYQSGIVEYLSPRGQDYIVLRQRPVTQVTELRFDSTGLWDQAPDAFPDESIQVAGQDYALKIDARSGGTEVGQIIAADADSATFAPDASGVDDAYNGATITILSGVGSGQVRTILDYVGATRTVTVAAWDDIPAVLARYRIDVPAILYSRSGVVYLLQGQGAARYARTARLTRELNEAQGTIKVTYNAGFPDQIFPQDLKLATLMLARALHLTARNAGWVIGSESTKYYNYSLSDILNKELHVRTILSTYKGMGLSMV